MTDVNKEGVDSQMLFDTVDKNRDSIFRMLVSEGANMNCRDDNNDTLLHKLVAKNNVQLCKFLLERRSETNMEIDTYNK